MGFYDEMAQMAREMLAPEDQDGLGQGVVQFLRLHVAPGPDQWTPGEPWRELMTLSAVVRRVEQKYVDGTLIVGTEDQVTFAVPSVEPVMTDKIIIDGTERVLVDIRRIPAAGTPVAYIAFVAGGGTDADPLLGLQPMLDFRYPANSGYAVLF